MLTLFVEPKGTLFITLASEGHLFVPLEACSWIYLFLLAEVWQMILGTQIRIVANFGVLSPTNAHLPACEGCPGESPSLWRVVIDAPPMERKVRALQRQLAGWVMPTHPPITQGTCWPSACAQPNLLTEQTRQTSSTIFVDSKSTTIFLRSHLPSTTLPHRSLAGGGRQPLTFLASPRKVSKEGDAGIAALQVPNCTKVKKWGRVETRYAQTSDSLYPILPNNWRRYMR